MEPISPLEWQSSMALAPDNRAESKHTEIRIICPGRDPHGNRLGEIYRYRELFLMFVWRNLSTRYRQMALGLAWALLEPVVQVLMISLFFGFLFRLPSDGIKYPIYVLSGLLPWVLFTRVINSAANSLRENMGLMSKVYFPRLLLPFSSIAKDIVDFLLVFILVLATVLVSGISVTGNIVFLPLFLILDLMVALGVGLAFAAAIVRFRDLGYLLTMGLQFWMYLTPIVYSSVLVPDEYRWLYVMNPMYWVVEGFRFCLLGKPMEFGPSFAAAIAVAIGILVVGLGIFSVLERRTVDFE